MTGRHDIWHRLKDHETSPPGEVFDRLQQLLEKGSAALADQRPLERLKGHEVAPPVFLREKIEERSGIKARVARKIRWYLSAAACLLLVVVGGIVYRSYTSGRWQLSAAGGGRQPDQGKVVPLPADTLRRENDTVGVLASSGAGNTSAPAAREKGVRPAFSIEGHTIHVADDDLLASFISFTYPDVPVYLTRSTDRPLRIQIDAYSSLYVSKSMLDMMQEMYKVLPNGKPARKARRMKRRLESWKEKDQKRFDNGNGANPLDPLDLAEFLFR